MSRWWSKSYRAVYGALIAVQMFFVGLNLAARDLGFAGLNMAVIAFCFAAMTYVGHLEGKRMEKAAGYRAAIVQARQAGNEEAEKFYMGMLDIWGGDPP